MAWELLAMWAIVIATIIWFIRDEKRLRAEAELRRAARYYAHAPKYRHVTVEPTAKSALPERRTGAFPANSGPSSSNSPTARVTPGSGSP